jgi:hypothetical protein
MRAFKVVRYLGGGLVSLDGEAEFTEGERYTGVFVVESDLENALYRTRSLAFFFRPVVLYEVDAELFSQQPKRYPVLGAPTQLRRRWKELMLAGKLEEAERLFEGELQIHTYPLTYERIACAVTLLRPLMLARQSDARFEKPRVAIVLAPEIMPLVQPIFWNWELHVSNGSEDLDALAFKIAKIAGGVW